MKPYPTPPAGLAVDDPEGGVLRIRLDRPDRRNAVTDDMVLALIETIEAAGSDERCVSSRSPATGPHFCSGFDLGLRRRRREATTPARPSARCASTSTA